MPAAIPISSMPTPYSTPLPLPRPHIATHSFHSHLLQYMPAARFVCAGLCRAQRPEERGMPAACPPPVCAGAQRERPRRKPAGTPGKCPEPGPAAAGLYRPQPPPPPPAPACTVLRRHRACGFAPAPPSGPDNDRRARNMRPCAARPRPIPLRVHTPLLFYRK